MSWLLGGVAKALGIVLTVLVRYFVTGRPLLGRPTDNATFFYAATQDMRGKPYEKLSGPIWQRLARRWAVAGVPLSLMAMSVVARVAQDMAVVDPPWVLVGWRDMAVRWWAVLTLGLSVFYGYRGVQFLRHRKVTDEFVYPAWEAACDAMGYKFRAAEARRMVVLPDDFDAPEVASRFARWRERRREARATVKAELSEEPAEPSTDLVPVGAATELETYRQPPWARLLPRRRTGSTAAEVEDDPVRIYLIPGKCATTAEENRFKQKVGPVLGMPDPQAKFVMKGRSPYVLLWPNHPPPVKATWADILRHVEATDIDHPVVGLSYGGHVERMDFLDESPHSLFSGASGTGKTTLLKLALSQRMHLGAQCFLFDFKVVSHEWAINLPGCTYVSDIADMHDLALRIGEIVEYRKNNAIPAGWVVGQPLNTFSVLDVVLEESNALSDALQTYWTTIKQPGDQTQSPAVLALRSAAFMGRQFSVFIWAAAQQASARIFGAAGGEVRESFQARFLAKPSIQTWKMLAGGVKWRRFPKGPRGIWSRIQNGEVAFFRVPWMEDTEAHEWALSGIPSPGQDGNATVEGETITVHQVADEPDQVTLAQALPKLPGPRMTQGALQQAAKRSGFPARVGVGKHGAGLYELTALRRWRAARVDNEIITELDQQFRGPGLIYLFFVNLPGVGRRIGYIGKTRRPLEYREEEHREGKPFADLFYGEPVVLWESDDCTDDELGSMEEHYIHILFPLYNIEFQMGAEHAVPKWTQIEERHARDVAAGRPLWEPRDVFNERKAAIV